MFSKNLKSIGFNFSLRITFWYFVIFTATFVSLFFIADYLLDRALKEKQGELLLTRAQEYRAHYEREGLIGLQRRFEERAKYTDEAFFIRVVGPVGKVLFFRFPDPSDKFDTSLLDEERDWSTRQWLAIESEDQQIEWFVLSLPFSGGVLQLGRNNKHDDRDRRILKSIFFNLFIPFLVIALIGGWLLTSQAIQPVRKLVQTIREILRTGKMETRVPVASGTEDLRELMHIFNQLLDKNQKLIAGMNESLDNVAHDLRTPMARLRASAEMALQEQGKDENYKEALQDCLEESDRVLTMLNVLMDVSEAQTGAMRLRLEELRLSQVAESVIDLYDLTADDKNIDLKLEVRSEKSIQADPVRIQQVVANLVDNAIKYSPKKSIVRIEIDSDDDWIKLRVIDEGQGIPETELPKIWDRLYRVDSSRSERGLGLGLSFVKAIVEAHGGQVKVSSEIGKGSRFEIHLREKAVEPSKNVTSE